MQKATKIQIQVVLLGEGAAKVGGSGVAGIYGFNPYLFCLYMPYMRLRQIQHGPSPAGGGRI